MKLTQLINELRTKLNYLLTIRLTQNSIFVQDLKRLFKRYDRDAKAGFIRRSLKDWYTIFEDASSSPQMRNRLAVANKFCYSLNISIGIHHRQL